MLYFALAALSGALISTLLGYASVAVIFAQVGELLFVFSALTPHHSEPRPHAMAAAMG